MSTEHVSDLLPAYILGCLDEEDLEEVAHHVANCVTCRQELETYRPVADALAREGAHLAPSPQLKERLMACIERQVPIPADQDDVSHELATPVRSPSWWANVLVWRMATVALLMVLIAIVAWWSIGAPRAATMRSSNGLQAIPLTAMPSLPQATGMLVLSADGRFGTLVVDGLPDLGPEKQYQLWLLHDNERVSGGVFSVNREGYGAVVVWAPKPLNTYRSFGVTVEPAGGSPGPTGEKVLAGQL